MQENPKAKKTFFIDSVFLRKEAIVPGFALDFQLAEFIKKHKGKSLLFSKHGRTENFYTSQSGLYFVQKDLEKLRRGEKIFHFSKKLDCILPKDLQSSLSRLPEKNLGIIEEIRKRQEIMEEYWSRLWSEGIRGLGLSKAWSVSIVFSVVLGMFFMTMLYRYLGQNALAREKELAASIKPAASEVLGDEDSKEKKEEERITQELLAEYQELLKKGKEKEEIAEKIREMTKGYPIEKMADDIAQKDKIVAAFLVGIAMKESTWGKHVPVLDGKDCYNYWGYRGKRERMGTGGHTCFNSPKDAVDTVSKRLEFLVKSEKMTTPEKMVTVWKCGYDCSWDDKKNVQKWISDVDKYFGKLNEKEDDRG
ncbi:MAG TPA: hypothetical protein P5262_01875 [Candidatus Moranbacteria bacterium]|nr:hypothetical protein [Candidatus Moranbacteria bacterium]